MSMVTWALVHAPALAVEQSRDARIRDIQQAEALAARGEAARDPLLLLAAARLLVDASAPETNVQPPRSPLALARRAAALAPADATIAELASRFEARPTKGLETGPLHIIQLIKPGDVTQHEGLKFETGKEAEIYLHGNGNGPLVVEVIDQRGISICHSDQGIDKALCRFQPSKAETYAVRIYNRSAVANHYRLLTN